MKLLNFEVNNEIHIGIKTKNGIIDLTKKLDFSLTMESLIKNFNEYEIKINNILETNTDFINEDSINFKEVVTNPSKILCVGLNYKDHKEEVVNFSVEVDEVPVIFNKLQNSLASHNQLIAIPKNTNKLDYEVELVIVIGKDCKDVEIKDASDYIFGYTIGNDLSARDLQMKTTQWLLGKTCDNFAPIGPYIVTKDELDINNLEIKCFVNNELKQSSSTSNMIYSCDYIVSYLSKHMTLNAGDIIFTGTPKGVILGQPKEEQVWLKKGDVLKLYIENIGYLENTLN